MMTDMPPSRIERILSYYGNEIPDGVGVAARRSRMGSGDRGRYPETVVRLHLSNGRRVGDGGVEFVKVTDEDGVVVRERADTDEEYEYWAMDEGMVQGVVYELTSQTSLVVVAAVDEYLPDSVRDDGTDESECGVDDVWTGTVSIGEDGSVDMSDVNWWKVKRDIQSLVEGEYV